MVTSQSWQVDLCFMALSVLWVVECPGVAWGHFPSTCGHWGWKEQTTSGLETEARFRAHLPEPSGPVCSCVHADKSLGYSKAS